MIKLSVIGQKIPKKCNCNGTNLCLTVCSLHTAARWGFHTCKCSSTNTEKSELLEENEVGVKTLWYPFSVSSWWKKFSMKQLLIRGKYVILIRDSIVTVYMDAKWRDLTEVELCWNAQKGYIYSSQSNNWNTWLFFFWMDQPNLKFLWIGPVCSDRGGCVRHFPLIGLLFPLWGSMGGWIKLWWNSQSHKRTMISSAETRPARIPKAAHRWIKVALWLWYQR